MKKTEEIKEKGCPKYRDYDKIKFCSHIRYTGPLNGFYCSQGLECKGPKEPGRCKS